MRENQTPKNILVTDMGGDSVMDMDAEGGIAAFREQDGGLTIKCYDESGAQFVHAYFARGFWGSAVVENIEDEDGE